MDRDELTFTLLNRYPYSSGHVMVVPLRHAPDLVSLSAEEGAAMFAATQRAIRALTEAMHPGGYNIGINQGAAAGASVEHVHLHVVPRWGGDTNFMPVLGDVKVLPEHLETHRSEPARGVQSPQTAIVGARWVRSSRSGARKCASTSIRRC